jgi:hypothetical protein
MAKGVSVKFFFEGFEKAAGVGSFLSKFVNKSVAPATAKMQGTLKAGFKPMQNMKSPVSAGSLSSPKTKSVGAYTAKTNPTPGNVATNAAAAAKTAPAPIAGSAAKVAPKDQGDSFGKTVKRTALIGGAGIAAGAYFGIKGADQALSDPNLQRQQW